MKNQILMFIIGMLVGAIITTGVFLYIKSKDNNKMPSMDRTNSENRKFPSRSNSNNTENTTSNNN